MEESLQPALLELSDSSRDFLAGGVGGAAGVVAGAPLDVVRVRQQTAGAGALSALQVFRNIVAHEGKLSLFKGLSYPLYTSAFQNAVCFHSYGAATRHLTGAAGAAGPLPYHQVLAAGCFAGAVQTAVVTPVDLLKIRLQLQRAVPGMRGYRGPWAMLQHVLRREKLTGLYRGTAITLVRDVPSYGIYYCSFEVCRELMEPGSRARRGGSPFTLWAAGGLAGVISWWSVYGFDVVKSRIQATSARASPYRGWVDCAWRSYQREGLGVFFRGFGATMTRAFLCNGAIFLAYELSHEVLRDLSQPQPVAGAAAAVAAVGAAAEAAVEAAAEVAVGAAVEAAAEAAEAAPPPLAASPKELAKS